MKASEIRNWVSLNQDKLNEPIVLNVCSKIPNPKLFFEKHLPVLNGQSSHRIKMLHYNRLIQVINIIENKYESESNQSKTDEPQG